MDNGIKFTSSQIRYMIWLYRLSPDGVGVKNVELATALGFSKPSVHNMLKALSDMGIVTQEFFGLAHLTEHGRAVAKRYLECYAIIAQKMSELCGSEDITENAICAVLADVPYAKIDMISRQA